MKILIADHHLLERNALAHELKKEGFNVVLAADTDQLTAAATGAVDIVFADAQLPPDGLCAMIDPLRNLLGEIPLVGLAPELTAEKCTRYREAGLTSVLEKPLTVDDLLRATARLMPEGASGAQPAAEQPEPPIDMEIMRQASSDDAETAVMLIELFFKLAGEHVADIEKALMEKQSDVIAQRAHQCCGSCASCGMTRLERLLRQLEKEAAAALWNSIPVTFKAVRTELDAVRYFLEKHFAHSFEAVYKSST
jgi:CheY-like chemotaxis protein/HPt (histidine-containing phosphotransfer) domain-containing protein